MTRLVADGPGVRRFVPDGCTDAFVRVVFPRPGVRYPPGLDPRRIRAELPRADWPRTRTYTVRRLDPVAAELTIDFVDHGPAGLAPPWLAALRPGDPVLVQDAGGRYRPDPRAGWHLLAGDETALPAIAVTLAALAPRARAVALVEVDTAADELPLCSAADVDLRWVHRCRGGDLVEAVRDLRFAPGAVQAFVHGEGGAVQHLRRHLLRDRAVAPRLLSASGYWRRGLDDEQWRARKAAMASPVPAAGGR
ncbi:siderophore-interacting protein [Actinoplanes teichomyceticus]|nr:siderophore-interacting protein [Actinoplanes teichomyceticus]GIF17140.1 siderophore-interacting protein [Actinoplanes teichomyceticus]